VTPVPFIPQPIPNVMGEGTWHWIYSTQFSLTFKDGSDAYLMTRCPHPVGSFFDKDRIVVSVTAERLLSQGWNWVYRLRPAVGDELEAYWVPEPKYPPPPTELVCELCRSIDRIRQVPARTAYSDRPNDPLILCADCCDDYQSYWDEMWNMYYSGIL